MRRVMNTEFRRTRESWPRASRSHGRDDTFAVRLHNLGNRGARSGASYTLWTLPSRAGCLQPWPRCTAPFPCRRPCPTLRCSAPARSAMAAVPLAMPCNTLRLLPRAQGQCCSLWPQPKHQVTARCFVVLCAARKVEIGDMRVFVRARGAGHLEPDAPLEPSWLHCTLKLMVYSSVSPKRSEVITAVSFCPSSDVPMVPAPDVAPSVLAAAGLSRASADAALSLTVLQARHSASHLPRARATMRFLSSFQTATAWSCPR